MWNFPTDILYGFSFHHSRTWIITTSCLRNYVIWYWNTFIMNTRTLWYWNFEVTFGCSIRFSDICTMGLLIRGDIGVLIFYLKHVLPLPIPGLIWDIPFNFLSYYGFYDLFSGNMFGSNPLSSPCTCGKLIPLDLACDPIWPKYFPTFSLPIL